VRRQLSQKSNHDSPQEPYSFEPTELNDLRKRRWVQAFSGEFADDSVDHKDLRATIVIEHSTSTP